MSQTHEISRIAVLAGGGASLFEKDDGQFASDVQSMVREFSATTPIQHYLAEKICERIWWLRRYESHKHALMNDRSCSVGPDRVGQGLQATGLNLIKQIDERIALEMKLMSQLQKMMEAMQTRTQRSQKLQLQIQLMERHLRTTDVMDLA